jgi:hypothetical protein
MISVWPSIFASKAEKESGNMVPILGGVYLSQNYLHVDYKRGNFSMARAHLGSYNPELVTVLDPQDGSARGAINVGAAVGIAIGSVVFGLALAAGVYFGWGRQLAQVSLDSACKELPASGFISSQPQNEQSMTASSVNSTPELLSSEISEMPSPVLRD